MKIPNPLLSIGLLAALPILQACERSPAWEGTVTDSAGITLVHNPSVPLWGEDEAWTVTEDLRIGTVAGEQQYQFGTIISLDAAEDGTVYVLDLQARNIRAYDAQGNYLRTIGGPGGGPGEFSQQTMFVGWHPRGEILVPDLGNQRVHRFAPEGDLVGSFPIQMQAGVPARWEVSSDGRTLAQIRGMNLPGMAALEEGDPIVVFDTTGTVVDTVALLPKGQTLEGISEQGAQIRVFAPEPLWDVDPAGSIYYAMNDRYRILVNDPEGTLARVITRDVEPKPVEETDRNAIRGLMREQYREFGVPPAQVEQIMQGVSFADFYPAFGNLFIGPEETLWVQRVQSARELAAGAEEEVEFDPRDIVSPEWEIFDAEGRYLGVVTLPDGFIPFTLKGDAMYGIWTDEMDVQYVMRLRVNRPGREGA